MFKIAFTPTASQAQRIASLPRDKRDELGHILSSVVVEIFQSVVRQSMLHVKENGVVIVEITGASPLNPNDHNIYIQRVANALRELKFDAFYEIAQSQHVLANNDNILSPSTFVSHNCHDHLMKAFSISSSNIPSRFLCSQTGVIMGNPAFLKSNPQVNYEYDVLMRMAADPITRRPISIMKIEKNSELRREISSFVTDMALNRSVDHYLTPNKDASTQCSLSSNNSALFATTKLSKEIHAVAAKALRRAVSENLPVSEVKSLLDEYGAENIMDLQDDNPQSGKTALHIAVLRNNTAAVQLLLGLGAKLDIKDSSGETAKNLAEKSENDQVKELFRKEETKNPSPR